MTIEMTIDQAQIVFSTLADEIYRISTCIAPENRKQSRIDTINELRKRIGVQLMKAGAIMPSIIRRFVAVCKER